MEMLDERKTKILKAIIRNYLETGEPVGSRTISKDSDLNLSSATIRNEMADLEEMGYILQPHTSAGRIPSDKGYRFYVDHLIEEKDEGVHDRTYRESGAGIKTGSKGTCNKYQLCSDDQCSKLSEEPGKIHPVITGR